jgi:serine/threonine-protein phosphatase 2A regulatory subunit B'
MVYNAMKLFMEINPQLFDDCSHEYTEQQNGAAAREALRERKWAALEELASKRKSNGVSGNGSPAPKPTLMPRVEEADSVTEDNQKRLDSLKLQDGDRRERRTHERQISVGSSRSQR